MATASTISSTTSTTSDSKTKPRPGQLSITPISAAASPASAASPPHSDVSTPTSTSTTSMPQIAIKPAATTIQSTAMAAVTLASAGPPKCSITSKEWVIPPRPKPGRKPATDTPPTKRKAQNRAAQRAFRERRAARVGELEEQLEEQREEHEHAQQELRSQVQSLDAEVQNLRTRCMSLESMLERERSERSRIETELESFKQRWRDETSSVFSRNSLPALRSRAPSVRIHMSRHQAPRGSIASNASDHRNSTAFSISQIISPPDTSSSSASAPQQAPADPSGCGSCSSAGPCACVDDVIANASVGCGKCSLGTKCECLEAVLKGSGQSNSELDLKRRHSSISPHAPDEKRQKSDAYAHEIDFTAIFSKKTTPQTAAPSPDDFQPVIQQVTIPPRDSCGFCQEGTYCMCAEAAAAALSQSQALAPMGNQVQTPPPSENDVGPAMEVTSTGAVKLPGIRSLNRTPVPSAARKAGGGCGPDGPGTCAQCLADPKSGLFCRSLAATAARASGLSSSSSSGRPDGGCCGGGGKGGSGCCKSQGGGASASTSSSVLGVSLSCADAYKTLSSHRNFERAADEIGTWLPKLRAIPQELNTSARAPIEVETASIMSVLKGFDVRFGKNA
ncbi:hypothetical protein DL765_010556 [Monosporascus sp. GIB2]|nr:hypothetical protein DL765_010556 [Monosporascus sp. GIB2]